MSSPKIISTYCHREHAMILHHECVYKNLLKEGTREAREVRHEIARTLEVLQSGWEEDEE